MNNYPKRLIEVDLPIKRISAHARREKSIRHGHISTLHIWWARRPLAACRAVVCASLWFDPADVLCPVEFKEAVKAQMREWAVKNRSLMSAESFHNFEVIVKDETKLDDGITLRGLLLDFIADFANWDNSTNAEYLEAARFLTHVSHLALVRDAEFLAATQSLDWSHSDAIQNLKSKIQNLPKPLVVDPFAGGGAIPLEALRVGADAFASDLNPVAVLLNKVVLEYIPRYGQKLADEVRKWGAWVKEQAEKELAEFYPKDEDGATPIAYLWARTIICEGPGCGAQVPLMRSLWLAKKAGRSVALQFVVDGQKKRVDFEIIKQENKEWINQANNAKVVSPKFDGTVRRGSAMCPVCGYTTPVASVRRQMRERRGGAHDARLFCVVTTKASEQGRFYRLPVEQDLKATCKANEELKRRQQMSAMLLQSVNYGEDPSSAMPSDVDPSSTAMPSDVRKGSPFRETGPENLRGYAADDGGIAPNDLERIADGEAEPSPHIGRHSRKSDTDFELQRASLSLVPDEPLPPQGTLGFRVQLYGMLKWGDLFMPRQALALTTLARLVHEAGANISQQHEQGFADAVQTLTGLVTSRMADGNSSLSRWQSTGEKISNTFGRQALPIVWDFSEANLFSTATRSLESMFEWIAQVGDHVSTVKIVGQATQTSATSHPLPNDSVFGFFTDPPYYDAVPYADLSDFFYVWLKRTLPASVSVPFADSLSPKADECIVDEVKGKDRAYFEQTMEQAMAEGRRLLHPLGVGLVVFAHKSTAGWEAQLQATVDAGWIVTGSWAIDTEMGSRLRAQNSAALASSIHLVVRPRENADGSLRSDDVGDWRDVLRELPVRLHEWMPRLDKEGIAGADAIFACLGPALEIFSRYSHVEKASGELVTLREYLEYVWAAVAKEALNMIFKDADATGFEADARLTAMWLWTLNTKNESEKIKDEESEDADAGEDDNDEKSSNKSSKISGFSMEFDPANWLATGMGVHLEKMNNLVEIKGDKARLLSVAERTGFLFGKEEAETPTTKRKTKKKTQMAFGFGEVPDEAFDAAVEETIQNPKSKIQNPTILDRIHQSMILFAAGRSEAMRRFLVDEGVGNNERFWRLANALSALYPTGSDEKRWVDGVLARKKGLGF